jgi:quercetin dioxygenase-like cupin family protein
MSAHLVDWDGIAPALQPNGTVKRRIAGAGTELVRMDIPAGCKAPRHSHPHEQFVQVLAGSGTIETEAGRREFQAGSVFHFPPDTWHAAEMATDTVLIETNLEPPAS